MVKTCVREEEGEIWRRGVSLDGLPAQITRRPMRKETDIDVGDSCKDCSRWMSSIPGDEVNKEDELEKWKIDKWANVWARQQIKKRKWGKQQETGRDRQIYWPRYQSRQRFLWEPTLHMCNEWLIWEELITAEVGLTDDRSHTQKLLTAWKKTTETDTDQARTTPEQEQEVKEWLHGTSPAV